MLRRSRLALFIVPNSSSPELPLFLSIKEKPASTAVNDVYRRVMAYDRKSHMNSKNCGGKGVQRSVAQRYFSGSLLGAAATATGIILFVLTFAYNVGKPVVDAHREYFSKLALKENGATDADDEEDGGDAAEPMEEFDDAVSDAEGERKD